MIMPPAVGHDLNISQTVDGVTVTLGRAYADANRVVLAFTVRSEDGRQYTVDPANLTAINGTAFESTAGFGTVISPALNPPPGTPPMDLQPDEIGAVHSFDTTNVGGAPTALNLRLIADATTFLPDDGRNFVGPFTFDFSVPFNGGRMITIEQTARTNGTAALQRNVTVAPSGAQAVVCFGHQASDGLPSALLQLSDGRIIPNSGGISSGGCSVTNLNGATDTPRPCNTHY